MSRKCVEDIVALTSLVSDVFHSTALRASRESISLINETVTGFAIATLKNVKGIQVSLSIQPISRSWLQAAQDAGGDVMGLSPWNGSLIGKTFTVLGLQDLTDLSST